MYDLRLENKKYINSLFYIPSLCDMLTCEDDNQRSLKNEWQNNLINDRDFEKYSSINRECISLCEKRIIDLQLYEKYKKYMAAADRVGLVSWLDGLDDGLENRLLIIIEQIKGK